MLPAVASMIVPPGLQVAASLGLLDHREPDAVLDRARRVLQLELEEELARPGVELPELEHRRPADHLEHVAVDFHGAIVTGDARCFGERSRLPSPSPASCLLAGPVQAPSTPRCPLRDDARVQAAVEDARAHFLPAGRLDRLDVTVLLAAKDGRWRAAASAGARPGTRRAA